jgi:hypothetical protein
MSFLQDLTLQQIFYRLVAFLIITGVHGFALAGIARLLGDPTPKYNARLTPNPFVHLSMPALAMAVLFRFGWIRPMKIKPENLRFGRFGLVLCWLGAVGLTLLLIPLLYPLRSVFALSLPRTAAFTVLGITDTLQSLALLFGLLNLLPLPLLTGSLLLEAAFPNLGEWMRRHETALTWIWVVAIVSGAADMLLLPLQLLQP